MKYFLFFFFISALSYSQNNPANFVQIPYAAAQSAKKVTDLIKLKPNCILRAVEFAAVVKDKARISSNRGDSMTLEMKDLLLNAKKYLIIDVMFQKLGTNGGMFADTYKIQVLK
jgi:hypothetical protein